MVGYNARANELFELHVAIMGYYDPATGSFINPWIPPQSGKQIFLADDEMLSAILSRKRDRASWLRDHRFVAHPRTRCCPDCALGQGSGQHAPGDHRQHRCR